MKRQLRGAQKKMKRRVLKKEARKARANHLLECCLMPVRRKTQRKPLSELYVNGHWTEDREEWPKELQRHCEGVYTDQEETGETQKKRIEYFTKKGDRHLTDEGRGAEITVDSVLQARAQLSENNVNGPEDASVSEMIERLPLEKVCTITRWFQERFMGQMDAPNSWKIVQLVFLRKLDAAPEKRNQKLQGHCFDIGDVEVVRILNLPSSGNGKGT